MRASLLFVSAIVLAIASSTSARADQTDPRLDDLFDQLRRSDSIAADEIVGKIQDVWAQSQSETATLLYARAFASASSGDYPLALQLADHVVGLAPSYAQGYALRAIVRARLGDVDGAVADFDKTLTLEPRQFEARTALAEILAARGRTREAYDALQDALKWNPHERAALEKSRALRELLARQDT